MEDETPVDIGMNVDGDVDNKVVELRQLTGTKSVARDNSDDQMSQTPSNDLVAMVSSLSGSRAIESEIERPLQEIAQWAHKVTNSDVVFLRSLDEQQQSFVVKGVAGSPASIVNGMLGAYTEVTETFRSASISDVLTLDLAQDSVEPVLAPNELWTFQQCGMRILVTLPLFASGELLGRIDFARNSDEAFEDHAIESGQIVAAFAAQMMEKARLQGLAERSQIYRTVIGLHQQIEQLADPPTILQAVVELVLHEPGCERCYAMLWDDDRQEFIPVAVAGLNSQLVEMLKLITLSPQVVPAFDRMMHSSRPLLVENARESTLLPRSLVRALGIESAMIVPLRGTHRRTIGFLLLDGGNADAESFSDHDVSVMEGIARHLSTMIENAMLYEQAVSSSDSLAVINEIGIQLAMLTDEESLFRHLHLQISSVIDATYFGLGLLEDNRSMIQVRVAADGKSYEQKTPYIPGRDSLSKAIQTGKGSLLGTRDASDSEQWAMNIEGLEPCHSQLTVPITVGRNVIGAMAVQSPFRHAYGPADLSMMTAVALHAGVALENARLYRMVQEQGNRRAVVLDRVMQRQENERKKLVEDIHDNTLQTLAALLFTLDRAQNIAANPERSNELEDELAKIRDEIAENIDRLRKRIFQLRPATLDSLGLESALREFLGTIEADSGMKTSLEVRLPQRPELQTETVLYRLIQEAVSLIQLSGTNASALSVRIRGGEDGIVSSLHASPERNRPPGPGLPIDRRSDVGILALIERAELAGGELRFARTVGGGSSVQISLPWETDSPSGSDE